MKVQSNINAFFVSACIRLLFLVLLIFFVIVAKELLIPLTIAVFLTFILLPVSQRLERLHFPRWLAISTSIILAIILISLFIWIIVMQLESFGDDLGELKVKITSKADSFQRFIREHFNMSMRDQSKWWDKKITETMDESDQYLLTFFSNTGSFLTNLALIPLYVFFLTLYRDKVKKFIGLISKGGEENTINIVHDISGVAQKYLKGLTIDVTIVAVLCSLSFLFMGVKHAILFGILVAVANIIIPYMGLTIASIFPFLMMIITHDEIGYALAVVGVCILIQFIDNHLINPYVVGSSVSINPLTAFIALVASAMIWGIFGMLLCIPITGMIKVVCDNVEKLKPYGYIIGLEMEFGGNKLRKHKRIKVIPPEKKSTDSHS